MSKPLFRSLVAGVLAVLLCACGGDTGEERTAESERAGLRIASFDFDESAVLAELYAQVLEAAGVPVVRLGSVGPREIVIPALELDRIDLVPEYLGTALEYAGSGETDPDTDSALFELRRRLETRGLTALEPAEAEDKNVIVVRAELAEENALENISDLASLAADQDFGGPAECRDRPLCLVGLSRVYGLSFRDFIPQRSLAFTAEALRREEIDVGLMFSTAAELNDASFVELVDDRELQPAENVVPVIRREALRRWGPEVATALASLAGALTTVELRDLNLAAANGEALDRIVSHWLTRKGLLR